MHVNRGLILVSLAGLTILFIGAAYSVWHDIVPEPVFSRVNPVITPKADVTTRAPDESQAQALRLTVTETGIAAITAKQLQQAKFQFEELSNEKLSLTYKGELVPFFVDGQSEEATLYFFAKARTGALEAPAVYILQQGQGQLMQQRDATPAEQGLPSAWQRHLWEGDSLFVEESTDEDMWAGKTLLSGGSWTYPFEDISPVGGQADLIVDLYSDIDSKLDPDHHVQILLNGRRLKDHAWDGVKHEIISIPLDEGDLDSQSVNKLTIVAPGDVGVVGDTIYIDSVQLEYMGVVSAADRQIGFVSDAPNMAIKGASEQTLVFDVTNEDEPTLLTNLSYEDEELHFAGDGVNRSYFALDASQTVQPNIKPVPVWANGLRDSGWGADYIAIVADEPGFAAAIEPLLTYRQKQGLRVTAVSLTQIFDEFGYGMRDPQAIRDFLTYTAENWESPAPQFVLLVGDATLDIREKGNGRNRNILPTQLVHTELGRYLASDVWYSGAADDNTASMAIGRFPAQNSIQLRSMVKKTMTYEQTTPPEAPWRERALLVSDDEPEFSVASTNLAYALKADGYKVLQLRMSYNDNVGRDIVSAINEGVGLVNYTGYGGEDVWGDEAALQGSDVDMMTNQFRLPILTAFTTRNGAFADPQQDTLAERMLRAQDRGIVAAIAPSGRPEMEKQLKLAELFYTQLLDDSNNTIGEALLKARQTAIDDPDLDSIMPMINLLGDPALQFHAP